MAKPERKPAAAAAQPAPDAIAPGTESLAPSPITPGADAPAPDAAVVEPVAEVAFAATVPASVDPLPEAAPVADPSPEALPLPEGHMFICTALSPLAHDGKAYGIGAELALNEAQMDLLLACGAVEVAR